MKTKYSKEWIDDRDSNENTRQIPVSSPYLNKAISILEDGEAMNLCSRQIQTNNGESKETYGLREGVIEVKYKKTEYGFYRPFSIKAKAETEKQLEIIAQQELHLPLNWR